jgi:hypothetical protein
VVNVRIDIDVAGASEFEPLVQQLGERPLQRLWDSIPSRNIQRRCGVNSLTGDQNTSCRGIRTRPLGPVPA